MPTYPQESLSPNLSSLLSLSHAILQFISHVRSHF
jgi:hypothetical protein